MLTRLEALATSRLKFIALYLTPYSSYFGDIFADLVSQSTAGTPSLEIAFVAHKTFGGSHAIGLHFKNCKLANPVLDPVPFCGMFANDLLKTWKGYHHVPVASKLI